MNKPNSFSKSEHLCGEIRISRLYSHGDAFIAYPLRVVYLLEPKKNEESVNVMVSVPKKKFKHAVKRNRLKRLMREAYRLNKQILLNKLEEKGLQIQIAFNYVSNDESDFVTVENKMKVALQKLLDKIEHIWKFIVFYTIYNCYEKNPPVFRFASSIFLSIQHFTPYSSPLSLYSHLFAIYY